VTAGLKVPKDLKDHPLEVLKVPQAHLVLKVIQEL
jgi:hypothetical protein